MVAGPWVLLLCLTADVVLQARAQPDSKGFISIDCGLSGKTGYEDDNTKISYAPDAGFIDAGTNHNISGEYMTPSMEKHSHNVRSFAGTRNCYTLHSLVSGLKYTVRAMFMYGNYDGLDRPPVFDLHIGVNYWHTVNISGPETAELVEAVVMLPDDFLQVCLVNTGSGTPFISSLDLRPLHRTHYPQVTAEQALALKTRRNFGPTDDTVVVRYPDDPHDRIWYPMVDTVTWTDISTTQKVRNRGNDLFEAPSAVLQTAIRPRNDSQNLVFTWSSEPTPIDPSPEYIVILYFAELEILPGNGVRQLNVVLNDKPLYTNGFTPDYLYETIAYNSPPLESSRYTLSVEATGKATLPPIINALEIFTVFPTANLGTDSHDVSAITAIKAEYQVTKNWMSDPCVPKTMAWDRLTCNYAIGSRPRITSLNLSSSGLNGDISSSFPNLTAVQYLDLSNNNLTGSVPDALSQLPLLTVLYAGKPDWLSTTMGHPGMLAFSHLHEGTCSAYLQQSWNFIWLV